MIGEQPRELGIIVSYWPISDTLLRQPASPFGGNPADYQPSINRPDSRSSDLPFRGECIGGESTCLDPVHCVERSNMAERSRPWGLEWRMSQKFIIAVVNFSVFMDVVLYGALVPTFA
jgi:hypothetical protein